MVGEERERHDAGVVHEDVDAPVLGDDRVDPGGHGGAVGDVDDAAVVDVGDVEADDGGAPLAQHAADDEPEAAGTAGDDRDLAFDVRHPADVRA